MGGDGGGGGFIFTGGGGGLGVFLPIFFKSSTNQSSGRKSSPLTFTLYGNKNVKKLFTIWKEYILPLLYIPVAIAGLYKWTKTSQFWAYDSERSILAPAMRLEKNVLAIVFVLTFIFLLPLIILFIWQIIKLTKSNKRLIKAFEREREFIKICKLKWRVREFEKAFPGEPLPYCASSEPSRQLTMHAHDNALFHCEACGTDHALLNDKGQKVNYIEALKAVKEKIHHITNHCT